MAVHKLPLVLEQQYVVDDFRAPPCAIRRGPEFTDRRIGRRKLLAYGVSSFFCGIAGALWAFAYLGTADANTFDLDKAFQILFIVIIGGSASLFGNFLGAAFIVLTPILLDILVPSLGLSDYIDQGALANVLPILFGSMIILLLIKEPDGLASLVTRVARRIAAWPLRV